MAQITRTDVYLKLAELSGMTIEEKKDVIYSWAATLTDDPQRVVDDLESYPNYAE